MAAGSRRTHQSPSLTPYTLLLASLGAASLMRRELVIAARIACEEGSRINRRLRQVLEDSGDVLLGVAVTLQEKIEQGGAKVALARRSPRAKQPRRRASGGRARA